MTREAYDGRAFRGIMLIVICDGSRPLSSVPRRTIHAAQAAEAGSVDILIAEDDALTRQSLRLLFEKAGYRCSEAEDGGRAVELARPAPALRHPGLVDAGAGRLRGRPCAAPGPCARGASTSIV